jgi:hypothetical protein
MKAKAGGSVAQYVSHLARRKRRKWRLAGGALARNNQSNGVAASEIK